MPNVAWGWLLVGILLGFVLRHVLRGRTAVTS
jgi:hypothetical protein